jgi:hypothetical protein
VTRSTGSIGTNSTRHDGARTDDRRADLPGPTGVVVPFPTVRPTGGAFTIDCADCAHRSTDVCDDCVVSFVVGRAPDDALVVDADEARAVRLLERAGLVPGVRHEARASGA